MSDPSSPTPATLAGLWPGYTSDRRRARALATAVARGDSRTSRRHRAALTRLQAQPSATDLRTRLQAAVTWQPDPARLPSEAGVYIIASGPLTHADTTAYVGLARDIHDRFHGSAFGHLTANSTRSRLVLAHPGARIGILPARLARLTGAALDLELGTVEALTWVALRRAGIACVNAVSNLARTTDASSQPIAATRLADGAFRVFASQSEATRILAIPAGRVAPVVCGFQRQNNGYAFRPGTVNDDAYLGRGWLTADQVAVASEVTWDGSRLQWTDGPLDGASRAALTSRRPATYAKDGASGYRGVTATPGRPGQWTAYYVPDPARRSHWTAIGRTYPSPQHAAGAREEFLATHPQHAAHNRSNADRLPTA